MFGIDTSSITGHDLANSVLGKTPEEICKKIPEIFRVLHIESVSAFGLTRPHAAIGVTRCILGFLGFRLGLQT